MTDGNDMDKGWCSTESGSKQKAWEKRTLWFISPFHRAVFEYPFLSHIHLNNISWDAVARLLLKNRAFKMNPLKQYATLKPPLCF